MIPPNLVVPYNLITYQTKPLTMKKLFLLSIVVLAMSCNQSGKESTTETAPADSITAVSLTKVWESDTTLTTPESVLFDPSGNVLYVSCINGVPPTAQDGDGFIAQVSPEDGHIIELQWATGLDAPKGMGIVDSILYVTNIDEIVAVDLATGEIQQRYPAEGAEFLNDITVDSDGNVYASDSNTSTIYKLTKEGALSVWLKNEALGGCNGLFADGDQMLVGGYGAGNFNTVDFNTMEIKTVVDTLPGADGVEKADEATLVSNWNGEVYYLTEDWEKKKILDTKGTANAADIEYVATSHTLYVPTFFANKVVAYTLSK